MLTASLAPFDWWPLGLVSLGGFFYLLTVTRSGWQAGFAYGVGKFGIGVSWIYVSIHDYGQAPPLLAGFLVGVFVAGMALVPTALGALYARFRSRQTAFNVVWFAALWLAFEWLFTWFLTGFPWLYAGYAHVGTPLAGWAPVGGVLLVGFFVALTAASAVGAWGQRRYWWGYAIAAIAPWVTGLPLAQIEWTESKSPASVALVQGNVDQAVKWLPENRLPIIRRYVELSEPHWDADLIVWPEAAITVFEHEAGELLARWQDLGRARDTALVLGIPSIEQNRERGTVFNNSAIGLGTASGRYVKRRLVPFGEYVPFEDMLRGLITFFDLPMSHAVPGPMQQPLLKLGAFQAGLSICYEVVYPNLVRDHAGRADVLLTITNDAWFGTSIGPLQHLQMVQMRSLENGRWMLRATNNGVTAIVDHRGRIAARLPQFEAGVLRETFEYRTGQTPYVVAGDVPVLVGVGLLLAAALGVRWWLPRRRGSIAARSGRPDG